MATSSSKQPGMENEAVQAAVLLLREFADRTGLTSEGPKQRYLWTDSFAVCTYLGLARVTGEDSYLALATRLVDQVHHVLGRYRPDDPRKGRISGLGDAEGESHPTRGGLRIGKKLPERRPLEPFDSELEWERDGQYFHYLTRWMHALDQVSGATREPRYNLWARELAQAAHASFLRGAPGARRMAWKMSTDLSRPLVATMGHHDPLDGLVTYLQLETTAGLVGGPKEPELKPAIAEFARMLERIDVRTDDPLGLGGLLSDAYRLVRILERSPFHGEGLVHSLLTAGEEGLSHCARRGDWRMPAHLRLAFRELGLAIGLSAVDELQRELEDGPVRAAALGELRTEVESLARHRPLERAIVSFWLDPENRAHRTWSEHRDINEVMLATALCPEGFLVTFPS